MLRQNQIEVQLDSSWEFYDLLNRLIKVEEVSAEQLCEGLCSPSMLSKIRKGERLPNKMLRDRLMSRLGIADGRNENFLSYEEYRRWEYFNTILSSIENEEYLQAEEMLQSLQEGQGIELQFYYTMMAQLYNCQGLDKSIVGKMYEKAVKITVPEVDVKKIEDMLLSPQELNLILEYVKYKHPAKLVQYCESIIVCIDKMQFDEQTRAQIYPKVVFYQCEAMKKECNPDCRKILRLSNRAIEILRATRKLYYLWELLRVRDWSYTEIINAVYEGKEQKRNAIAKLQEENTRWLNALEEIYSRFNIVPSMKTFNYLYFQTEIYCINDVIRIRREMLGMTKKELCENICDEKTIGRLENHQSKVQMPIVKKLFERLGLSGEFQRIDVISSNPESLKIIDRLMNAVNNYELDVSIHLLEELEMLLSMDYKLNRQYMKRYETLILMRSGEISKEEGERRIKEALEYTILYEDIKDAKEIYLTNGELSCIHNMAICKGNNEINEYHIFLKKMYEGLEEEGKIREHISMYEFVMPAIASVLGNSGDYDASDIISKKIILEDIRSKRMGMLDACIYSTIWNSQARFKKGMIESCNVDIEKELELCVTLSKITKKTHFEEFYSNKLKELRN